jgi:hypothetical protein
MPASTRKAQLSGDGLVIYDVRAMRGATLPAPRQLCIRGLIFCHPLLQLSKKGRRHGRVMRGNILLFVGIMCQIK